MPETYKQSPHASRVRARRLAPSPRGQAAITRDSSRGLARRSRSSTRARAREPSWGRTGHAHGGAW